MLWWLKKNKLNYTQDFRNDNYLVNFSAFEKVKSIFNVHINLKLRHLLG